MSSPTGEPDRAPGWVYAIFGFALALALYGSLGSFVAAQRAERQVEALEKRFDALKDLHLLYEANVNKNYAIMKERTKNVGSSLSETETE